MSDEKNSKSLSKRKIELRAISEWVSDGERVLDLGCGRGILLSELMRQKNIYAVGVDSDFAKVTRCVKRGVNVYHGDIMDALSIFDKKSFDWIICSRTLQELENARDVVLKSLEIARHVAVGFVNHSYWRNRLAVLLTGDRIVNEVYPEHWEESRPMNPISIKSFERFCKNNDIVITRKHFLRGDWETPCNYMPELFSGYAIYEISKKDNK